MWTCRDGFRETGRGGDEGRDDGGGGHGIWCGGHIRGMGPRVHLVGDWIDILAPGGFVRFSETLERLDAFSDLQHHTKSQNFGGQPFQKSIEQMATIII